MIYQIYKSAPWLQSVCAAWFFYYIYLPSIIYIMIGKKKKCRIAQPLFLHCMMVQ